MEPIVTTTIIEIITSLGLPVSMVVALGWFLYKFINKTMLSHEETLKKYEDALNRSQSLNLNHAAHIQTSLEKLVEKLERHDVQLEKIGDRIVHSIEKQTDLLRDFLKEKK